MLPSPNMRNFFLMFWSSYHLRRGLRGIMMGNTKPPLPPLTVLNMVGLSWQNVWWNSLPFPTGRLIVEVWLYLSECIILRVIFLSHYWITFFSANFYVDIKSCLWLKSPCSETYFSPEFWRQHFQVSDKPALTAIAPTDCLVLQSIT